MKEKIYLMIMINFWNINQKSVENLHNANRILKTIQIQLQLHSANAIIHVSRSFCYDQKSTFLVIINLETVQNSILKNDLKFFNSFKI